MLKQDIVSFLLLKLIFLIIIIFFSHFLLKKFLYKDNKIKFSIKYIALGIVTTFLGPFVCATIYTFGHFTSIFSLAIFGLLSFLITVFLCSVMEFLVKNFKNKLNSSKGVRVVLFASLIIPSTALFLMFLFFLSWTIAPAG